MSIRNNYNHTIYASYIGYITQAIVNNFAPLLFITFSHQFSLTLDKIALITTLNFLVQLTVDRVSAGFVDKIGYRISVILAHVFSAAGLILLGILPGIMADSYAGILFSVVLYAIGGGLIEVLISPIVEACPTEKKEAVMSLLHSFYCWGHVGVILISTLFFTLVGIDKWQYMSMLWALIPLLNCFYFAVVPIIHIAENREPLSLKQLMSEKLFWIFMVIMICAGASEHCMSQWASAFAEAGLHVSKTMGDLLGPCAFALLMGTARAIYGNNSDSLPLKKTMIGSAVLCIVSYLLASLTNSAVLGLIGCAICGFSVGIFWPGTFSVMAVEMPDVGTSMYALMALAGDVGCSAGPTMVGFIANAFNDNLKYGLLAAVIFPIMILIAVNRLSRLRKDD
ncbi:MAG: MFS transporter [Erysipelotrichaceae bacterium]|nr:MFS transporter [Erysipelotrichaceae bacterium]